MISIDPQAAGWHDDASYSGGVLNARLVRGELVSVPFRDGQFTNENAGTSGGQVASGGLLYNNDGTGGGLIVTVPAGTPGAPQGMRVWQPFYGRAFGLRWRRDGGAPAHFTVVIDGQAYRVNGQDSLLQNDTLLVTDGECRVLVADDLPEGLHHAEIVVVMDPSVLQTLVLFAYLVERRAGYEAAPRLLHIPIDITGLAQQTNPLPTSATVIQMGSSPGTLRNLRKILYCNTTGSSLTVTVQNVDGVGGFIPLWRKVIAANDTAELDFGDRFAFVGANLKHLASGAGVNYTMIGGV